MSWRLLTQLFVFLSTNLNINCISLPPRRITTPTRSVTMSLAAMANVSLVVLMFFIIFAILGVQLFSGKMWSCNDSGIPDHAACTGTFLDPETGLVRLSGWLHGALLGGWVRQIDLWHFIQVLNTSSINPARPLCPPRPPDHRPPVVECALQL